MKLLICIALLAVTTEADKCEFGHTWHQGQQGSLEITVPANTVKWVVEMTFDKAPKHIKIGMEFRNAFYRHPNFSLV